MSVAASADVMIPPLPAARYDYIYLSPHLDDAVLSCGGMLASQSTAGAAVLVVTVCSGIPCADTAFSPFAQHLHAQWNVSPHAAVQSRIAEDQVALDAVGVDACRLDFLDAIYRQPDWYNNDLDLFGAVAPTDPLRQELPQTLLALVQGFPQATIYAPLGVGNHVDHQVVYAVACDLARQGYPVICYEDFPYVCAADALDQRLRSLGGVDLFAPEVVGVDPTIEQKIAAITAYSSQLDLLFGGSDQMASMVKTYAQTIAPHTAQYAERLWQWKAGVPPEFSSVYDV